MPKTVKGGLPALPGFRAIQPGKFEASSSGLAVSVMAGLAIALAIADPAIPLGLARPWLGKRDARGKPGHDE
jgi:hypothetical protein